MRFEGTAILEFGAVAPVATPAAPAAPAEKRIKITDGNEWETCDWLEIRF